MLRHLQEALARLATDPRQRRRWAADPSSAGAELSLSGKEIEALRAVPLAALERYAGSLVAKRWGEVKNVIPATLRVCPSVERRYRTWALSNPARAADTVLPPGAAEAARALPALTAALRSDPGEASYAADLLTYETLAACSRVDGAAREMTSGFRIDRIAREIATGLVPVDPERATTELRFEGGRVRWRPAR
jgi:hypothetical protein